MFESSSKIQRNRDFLPLCINQFRFLFLDFWWKVTITIAVIIIACFMIYQAVADEKKSTTKTKLSSASSEQKIKYEEEVEESKMKCRYGSIQDSRATFTYQPYNSTKVCFLIASILHDKVLIFGCKILN